MEHVIKINGKVFTICGYNNNQELRCPTGDTCYLNKSAKVVLHRDSEGKIQSEPIREW